MTLLRATNIWLPVAAVLATAGLSPVGGAAAQAEDESDEQQAKAHFQTGAAYYGQSRYEEAASQFMEAYALSERPLLLINASQAYERALLFDRAIETAEDFLERAPEDDPNRKKQEVRLEQLRQLAERKRRQERRGETGGEAGSEPAPGPDGATEASPAPESGGLGGLGWTGVGLMGAGGALGLVSLATGLVANGKYSDLDDACTGGTCPSDRQDDIDRGRTLATVSTVTLFAAAGVGVAGLVLFLLDDGPSEEQPTTTAGLRLEPGPGDVGLATRWSF
ncbi:MAG: tetratricopeptide repeat protein [Myxococcota bacterium]